MFPKSHKAIATTLYKTLESHFHIHLDLKILKKASVLPDFHIYWRLYSHRKKHMSTILHNLIYNLENDIYAQKDFKDISKQLGVIFHFICDFFTTSHNRLSKRQWFKHYTYEKELEKYILSHIPTVYAYHFDVPSVISFEEYFECVHKDYLKSEPGFHNDLFFSLDVLMYLCLYLFKENIKDKKTLIK